MHVAVQIVLALVVVLLLLMAVLALFAIQVVNMYSKDKSCTASDPVAGTQGEFKSIREYNRVPHRHA
jgi:Tfp pilus assembly protein PilV